MQVVARLLDGRKIKGHTTDFHPSRERFRVAAQPGFPPVEVPTEGLKAVFFVRSFEGNPERRDHRQFPGNSGFARPKIWIEFRDGERMAAWPVSTPLGRHGFYVVPTDPGSNAEKAYVFRDAVARVLQGNDALAASRAEEDRRKVAEREPTVVRVL
jgi:hypothetical protein